MTSGTPLTDVFPALRPALEAVADPEKVESMAGYIKGHFDFLGVPTPVRRSVAKPAIAAAKAADPDALLAFAARCWGEPEREFQYIGADALRAGAKHLRAGDLQPVREFIEDKGWWDTVDSLAAWTVGPMVWAHPALVDEMDLWIDDSNIWVARTAILHQLSYKGDADADRLFSYADKRASDNEFFIRKALGWALRQHSRFDPDAVVSYVDRNAERLSGLTKREALKRIKTG